MTAAQKLQRHSKQGIWSVVFGVLILSNEGMRDMPQGFQLVRFASRAGLAGAAFAFVMLISVAPTFRSLVRLMPATLAAGFIVGAIVSTLSALLFGFLVQRASRRLALVCSAVFAGIVAAALIRVMTLGIPVPGALGLMLIGAILAAVGSVAVFAAGADGSGANSHLPGDWVDARRDESGGSGATADVPGDGLESAESP